MHGHLNALMTATVEWADQVSQRSAQEDYVLAGELNLMDFKELSAVDKLRALFDTFTRKRDILHLLDQAIDAEEMQIFSNLQASRTGRHQGPILGEGAVEMQQTKQRQLALAFRNSLQIHKDRKFMETLHSVMAHCVAQCVLYTVCYTQCVMGG